MGYMVPRIEVLKRKLAARENVPGYEKNCDSLREEIARLESLMPAAGVGDKKGS